MIPTRLLPEADHPQDLDKGVEVSNSFCFDCHHNPEVEIDLTHFAEGYGWT